MDKKSKRRNIELLDILFKGGGSQNMAALLLSEKKEQKEMESMRDVNRVMEHEINIF